MRIQKIHFTVKCLILGFLVVNLSGLSSCDNEGHELHPSGEVKEVYFKNTPLSENQDTLRVLVIGNSYSYDGTAYISELLDSAHIERSRYCVYMLAKGNTSLKYWKNELKSGENHFLDRIAGNLRIPAINATMPKLLSQPWDIVVMQQLSSDAVNYSTYNPSLRILIDSIRNLCTNPDVTLAWQLIHAYGKDSKYNKKLVGYNRWKKIAIATRTMVENDGINIVIPTGTAIQLARETELETPYDLTRDNTHLCYGVGRYIAACCWIETLFKPSFGVSIKGNTANHPLVELELNDSQINFIPASSVPVTDQNRELCQQCALDACTNPYEISPTGNTSTVLNYKK